MIACISAYICNNGFIITYYYIGLFHYYIIITHYVIISHYYLLLTGQLADGLAAVLWARHTASDCEDVWETLAPASLDILKKLYQLPASCMQAGRKDWKQRIATALRVNVDEPKAAPQGQRQQHQQSEGGG